MAVEMERLCGRLFDGWNERQSHAKGEFHFCGAQKGVRGAKWNRMAASEHRY